MPSSDSSICRYSSSEPLIVGCSGDNLWQYGMWVALFSVDIFLPDVPLSVIAPPDVPNSWHFPRPNIRLYIQS